MKVYQKRYGIKRVVVVGIRKVYTEPNAGLAWELDYKGADYENETDR